MGEAAPDIRVWYGGLVDGMRDASGQMYMRNRYYDPATGQFTQTDPIGLATRFMCGKSEVQLQPSEPAAGEKNR